MVLLQAVNITNYSAPRYALYVVVIQVKEDGTVENYNSLRVDSGIVPNTSTLITYRNNTNGIKINSTETIIDGETYNIEVSFSNGFPESYNRYHTVYVGVQEEVIAIRYKDKVYYNTQIENLTAGQPDVKKGKTFIGYMGYVEEGTMEV